MQVYLARAGVASRRASEELIGAGRVAVGGETVTAPGSKVTPGSDRVTVDGRLVTPEPIIWVALHKPAGYVTSREDELGRRTIYDLLPPRLHGLFHVGRLDRESEGLLLLSNDGALANRLLHPRYGVRKRYRAWVKGAPTPEVASRLAEGIELEDGLAKAASVRLVGKCQLELVLNEGRKREVRRMLEHAGHPVRRLLRLSFGAIELGALEPGKWRELSEAEVSGLRS